MYDELIRILEQCGCSEETIIGVLGLGASTGLMIALDNDQPEMREFFIDIISECDLYIAKHTI